MVLSPCLAYQNKSLLFGSSRAFTTRMCCLWGSEKQGRGVWRQYPCGTKVLPKERTPSAEVVCCRVVPQKKQKNPQSWGTWHFEAPCAASRDNSLVFFPFVRARERLKEMKIDSYTHFACPAFMEHLEAESGHPMVFRGLFSAILELSDIDVRIRQVQADRIMNQVNIHTCVEGLYLQLRSFALVMYVCHLRLCIFSVL